MNDKSKAENSKGHDLKVAKQLQYNKKVLEMLEDENDPLRRQRILTAARKGSYDEEE